MSDLPRIASEPARDARLRLSAEVQITGNDYQELARAARRAAVRLIGDNASEAYLHIREVVPIEAADGTPALYIGVVHIAYPWDDIF